MSRSRAWAPRGPALEIYDTKIRSDLEATLANIELPEGAPLFLKLYMIGRDENSASPMVMVCCVNRDIRKDTESSIRESRVLERFPGFGLGSSALLLESKDLEELVTNVSITIDSGEDGFKLTLTQKEELWKRQVPDHESTEFSSTLEIHGTRPTTPGRTIRFIWSSHGNMFIVHEATSGPIIQLGAALYQITAGHGARFNIPEITDQYIASGLDGCDFDGQSDCSDEIITSRGSVTPEGLSRPSSEGDTRDISSDDDTRQEDQHMPSEPLIHEKAHQIAAVPLPISSVEATEVDSIQIDLVFHNRDLDYALLKFQSERTQLARYQIVYLH